MNNSKNYKLGPTTLWMGPRNSGQATLETLVSLIGTLTFVSLLLGTVYLAGTLIYLKYSSHEFLLCREFQNPFRCEQKFKKQLSHFWRFGTWKNFESIRSEFQQSVHFDLELRILRQEIVTWKYQDQIRLPLKF